MQFLVTEISVLKSDANMYQRIGIGASAVFINILWVVKHNLTIDIYFSVYIYIFKRNGDVHIHNTCNYTDLYVSHGDVDIRTISTKLIAANFISQHMLTFHKQLPSDWYEEKKCAYRLNTWCVFSDIWTALNDMHKFWLYVYGVFCVCTPSSLLY